MPTPRTEVYAFATPAVKPGQVDIAMRVSGGLHVLSATRSVWFGLFSHLKELFNPQQPSTPKLRKFGKRGKRIGAERRALYVAAYREWRDTPNAGQREVAAKHGVNLNSFVKWLQNNRDEVDAELAAAKAGGAT